MLCGSHVEPPTFGFSHCGGTWPHPRRELDKIHVGTFAGPAGTFRQRTEITKAQRDILRQLKIDVPPRIYQLRRAAEP